MLVLVLHSGVDAVAKGLVWKLCVVVSLIGSASNSHVEKDSSKLLWLKLA